MSKRVLYNITSASLQATNISGGTINATTFTGGNLSLSGDLKVAGTLTTVNITSTNLVNTNVSAGVVVASTLLSATGNSNTIGNIFTTGGNVGVGTTSPASQLDVNGSIVCRSSLSAISTSGNVAAFFASDNSVLGWSFGLDTDTSFKIKGGRAGGNQFTNSTFGTTRFTINTGGNVGIGTTSPAYTLDVTGSFRLNSTAVQNFVIGSTSGTVNNSTYLVSSHGNLEIGIAGGAGSFNNSSIAGDVVIRSSKNLMLQSGELSPNLYIATSGNIGIACTAPTHLFSVGIAPNGTTKGSISINTSDESRYHLFNYAGVAEWLFGQKSTSRSDFTFSKLVAGTETDYLTISTGGNVGIGTTAPGATLDISGTIRASTSITTGAVFSTNITSTNVVATNVSAGTLNLSTGLTSASATIGTSLLAIGNSNTVGAIITTGGNVGIGTTGPRALLHLHNTSMPELILSRYTSNISGGNLNHGELTWKSLNRGVDSAIIRSTSQAVDGLLGWDDAGRLEFLTSTGPGASLRMVISESGNVGIGTSTPGSILHVAGAAGSLPTTPSGNGVHMGIDTNSNSGIQLNAGSNGSGNYEYIDFSYSGAETVARIIHNNSNRSLLFQVNSGTNAMQLNSSGSVSIPGALSKGSGTFDIEHPILEDKRLVHSFIEGPRCDLIYRGAVTLTNGTATVNIDTDCVEEMDCVMTEGTFTSLCANPQFFLQNPNSFNRLRGSISGNILTIICEDNTSTDEVYWQVIAERKDPFIKRWNRTNANGYLVTEYNKE